MELPTNDMKYIVPQVFDYKNADYILVRYEPGKISVEELCKIHKMFQEQFPNSKVIGLPNEITIKNCTKAELTEIYEMLKRKLSEEINNVDVGQTVYVIAQERFSSPYEVVKCTVNRKTVKTRKTFSVSGRYSSGDYYNGTFVEKSINKKVFLFKDKADYECERLNNK